MIKRAMIRRVKAILVGLFILLVIFIVGCRISEDSRTSTEGIPDYKGYDADSFAQCLTEKGVTFFGAYWCPHCADQKKYFGDSFTHVNYVECSLPNRAGVTEVCERENIERYPTWEFGDGSRREGLMSLEMLSERSGCELVKNEDI